MPALVDTHCHLADPSLYGDLDPVMARAVEAGVGIVISVGAIGPIEADLRTVEIADKHDCVFAAVGVHPHDAGQCDSARMTELAQLARSRKVVAIGETGLDFHYMRSPREAQEMSFRRHLELAAKLDLPVVIHCRDAETRVAEIVHEVGMPDRGGVIHCFTGDIAAAREFIETGFYISFSGIVTFKNAGALRAAVAAVPDNRILVETDAPYLAPDPYRGKRNEPAYIVRTLEVLARIRNVDPNHLAARIIENASRLLRLS